MDQTPGSAPPPLPDGVTARIAELWAAADRDDMAPTVAAFEALVAANPPHPVLEYELGGAYDSAGLEAEAVPHYEAALAGGLDAETRAKCLLQYGSTLRNLERHADAVAVLETAVADHPDHVALRLFLAFARVSGGAPDAAVADLVHLAVDRIDTPDVHRYSRALRAYADELAAGER